MCSKRCRKGPKQAARRAANIGTAEIMARVTTAARRRGPRGAKYDLVVARLNQMAGAGLATLTAADRHLVQRYFGLGGVSAASLRQLAAEANLARSAITRRVHQSVLVLIGVGELGRACVVCGRDLSHPPGSRRRTCGRACEPAYHRQLGSHERLRAPARRQGREATEDLRSWTLPRSIALAL